MNEVARKDANPNVPYTPEEIVADAIACHEAGAAITHFHARNPDGSESNRIEDYRAVVSGIRSQCDALIHPTLGQFDSVKPDQRLDHFRLLYEEGLAPDMAPLDTGSNNIDVFDPGTAQFVGEGSVYVNTAANLRYMAGKLAEWGVRPQMCAWSVPNLRLAGAFLAAGLVPQPSFVTLVLSGGGAIVGHPATPAGLRAYLDNMPDQKMEWSVLCGGAEIFPLVPEILSASGHISVGLGDAPYTSMGEPANSDIVRRIVEMAQEAGREIATPQEARAMLAPQHETVC
ncbi:MAG: 3-keto-5-aminohexanoate cleavage protein [Sphingomonadaceae bacterium]|nr:3-keto-5-aminohexanoate cleavage protein [Sphingomonadaceae bacterium]